MEERNETGEAQAYDRKYVISRMNDWVENVEHTFDYFVKEMRSNAKRFAAQVTGEGRTGKEMMPMQTLPSEVASWMANNFTSISGNVRLDLLVSIGAAGDRAMKK